MSASDKTKAVRVLAFVKPYKGTAAKVLEFAEPDKTTCLFTDVSVCRGE